MNGFIYSAICDNKVIETVPAPLKDAFTKIISFYKKYSANSSYINLAVTRCTKIDPYTEYVCKELKKHLEIYKKVCNEADISNEEQNPLIHTLIAALIVKNKAYRINSKAYNRIKNNKLLRILCRK